MLAYITREQLDAIRAADPKFNYDTSLPQGLYNDLTDVTGKNPCGHIVFVYPSGMIAGGLQPTDLDGCAILAEYFSQACANK